MIFRALVDRHKIDRDLDPDRIYSNDRRSDQIVLFGTEYLGILCKLKDKIYIKKVIATIKMLIPRTFKFNINKDHE